MTNDTVRVLRLVQYEGPRDLVEKQIQVSVHGTRVFGRPGREMRITAVTLDEFPRTLDAAREEIEDESAKRTHLNIFPIE